VHLTFSLDHPSQKLGVPTGKYLYIRCSSASGEKVVRSYTPISDVDRQGEFELIFKLYRAVGNRPAGKMSACIDVLREGDTVECKGPFGQFEYSNNRSIVHKGITRKVNKLTMIAGGSGITPMYSILRCAQRDGIECNVIYFNKTEDDILLRKELTVMHLVDHWLSQPSDQWNGLRGHVSAKHLEPVHDGLLLFCRPPGMMDAVDEMVKKSNWDWKNQLVRF
jgi:nitrate reductase (NAD(P)H)